MDLWIHSIASCSVLLLLLLFCFFFSSRRRHTRYIGDWSSDVCSSDLKQGDPEVLSKGIYCCGPGTLISLDFYKTFMEQYNTPEYCYNFRPTIDAVKDRKSVV